jgi:hypothetical protein
MTSHQLRVADWAWQQQSVWSQTADRLKSNLTRARRWAVVLSVVAAAFALASSQLLRVARVTGVTLAVCGAVAAAGLTLLTARQSSERISNWTRARSVAEALKADVFTYLSGRGPYAGTDGDQRLNAEARRVIADAADLAAETTSITALVRPLPAVHDAESYLLVRVQRSQLDGFYEPNTRVLTRRLLRLKTVTVGLTLLAAGFAALATASANLAAWAAVATTATGAITTYATSERWEFLRIEYARTAQELRRLLILRTAPDGTPLTDDQLVARCEDVISVQNQTWMAKWGSHLQA